MKYLRLTKLEDTAAGTVNREKMSKKGKSGILRHWTNAIASMFTLSFRKTSIRTAIGAILVYGCLSTASLYAAPGDPGAEGEAGTAGTAQVTEVTTANDAEGTVWGEAGTSGIVGDKGEDGRVGNPGNFGGARPDRGATSGGAGGAGGAGGVSGTSGSLLVTVNGSGEFQFSSTLFGANGIIGAEGGSGAEGGHGGGNIEGFYCAIPDAGHGAAGGAGGVGAAGANAGEVTFSFVDGISTFEPNTVFGGIGGNGGSGGVGGNGGIGGNAYSAQKGYYDPVEDETYPDHDAGDGGNGADGGIGGDGGNGGNGANAKLTVQTNAVVNFGNVQFGGSGGNGGTGGIGGTGGKAGKGGAESDISFPGYTSNPGNDGTAGKAANGGNGGAGGAAGNGTLIVSGGTVNFLGTAYFGGTAGTGGAGGAAGGDGATAGTAGAVGAAASGSALTINSGTVNLGGDIVFRGTGNTMTVNGGTISYGDDYTINLGSDGTFAITNAFTLERSTETGMLEIIANAVTVGAAGEIIVDFAYGGEFLSIDANNNELAVDKFNLSSYDEGSKVELNNGVYTLTIVNEGKDLYWTATDSSKWEIGAENDNWVDDKGNPTVFGGGYSANFDETHEGNVELVGAVNAKKVNVNSGDYVFDGAGHLAGGVILNVSSGASLSLENTANANSISQANISGTLSVASLGLLGTGNIVNNGGELNIAAANGDVMSNVMTGNGAVNVNGVANDGTFTLSGKSAATGLLTQATGSLEITGSYAGSINVEAGNLTLNSSDAWENEKAIAVGGDLVQKGSGHVTLSGDLEVTGDLQNASNLTLSGTNIEVGSIENTGNLTIAGTGNSVVEINNNIENADGNLIISRDINVGGSMIQNGSGTLTLSGDNTITGSAQIQEGTIVVGSATAFGSANIEIWQDGVLNLNGNDVNNDIEMENGSIINDTATVATVGSAISLKTAGSPAKVGGAGDIKFTGILTGDGGIDKIGTGTVVVANDNSYQGETTVIAGTLQLGDGGTTGSVNGDINVKENAKLVINRKAATADDYAVFNNAVAGAGEVIVNQNTNISGAMANVGGITVNNAKLAGNVSANSALTLNKSMYDASSKDQSVKSLNVDADSSIQFGDKDFSVANGGNLAGSITGTSGAFNMNGGNLGIQATGSVNGGSFNINNAGYVKVADGGQIKVVNTTVTTGATLEVTAALNKDDAAIQSGTLDLKEGSTLLTNLKDYGISAGELTAVYVTNDTTVTGATNDTLKLAQQLLYKVDSWDFVNGNLVFNVKRRFGSEMFPNVSPSIAKAIDTYNDGNVFFEALLDYDTDAQAEVGLQSGYDFVNLGHAMSATYEAKMGINRALETRMISTQRVGRSSCDPCDPCDPCGSTCLGQARGAYREAWASMIYENAKGFRLNSGNFKHGYRNDLYGIAFGVDRTNGNSRLGIMGVGGWGKLGTTGRSLMGTKNETSYGGVYGYFNERTDIGNFFFSAGWLGMDNDIKQYNADKWLKGNMDSGLASISIMWSETFRFGDLRLVPIFGLEYGYYYQDAMKVKWGKDTVFANEKAHAHIVTLPIGVKLNRKMNVNGGVLTPELRGRYIANVGDVTTGYNTWAAGTDIPATLVSTMHDRHAGEFGLGIGWKRGWFTLTGDYGYMFSKKHQNQFVSVAGAYRF